MLRPDYTPAFKRDAKRIIKPHRSIKPLEESVSLIFENTPESISEPKRRHNMHTLSGKWSGSNECHVCNAGDWLLIWSVKGDLAVMQRTGTHDVLIRSAIKCTIHKQKPI